MRPREESEIDQREKLVTLGPVASGILSTLVHAPGGQEDNAHHDADQDAEAPAPSSPTNASAADHVRAGRLQLCDVIGHGGMGVVLKGYDADLGRDLAVKVLRDRYRDQPEMVRRFIEEAQIGGQLQHSGVVPVYELGTLADRRPYIAMKWIRGRTLAEVLAGRSDCEEDRAQLLAIFESACQTMAYAHARGVIHRDLKPSNIMVGSFGEVQVMDWGLAKVMTRAETSEEPRPIAARVEPPEPTVVTGRRNENGERSRPGDVMGTPAYMAPSRRAARSTR